ncbi:MAG TPA: SNF2 helicase-associated domain-containing protein, partial [Thermomonospora sp.]|nr:SNF2 helicase-associated domain-containing protein [Thermomonospora sp.]
MLVAHAVWHGGALCLWAERSGPRPADDSARHPYATNDFSGTSYEPFTRGAPRITLDLLLPTTASGPLPSPELATGAPADGAALVSWPVPALAIDPFAAMALLQQAEEAADVVPGMDLRYLRLVADTAHDLVRRGRVLPALTREDGEPAARWRPVPDPARIRRLAEAMPPACRAADGGRPAGDVLREALGGLTDTFVRGAVPHPLLPPRKGRAPDPLPLTERWMNALTGPDPAIAREPGDDLDGLAAELDAWAAAAHRPSGPMRTCFRLVEPDPAGPPDVWRVEFALQGTDDPSLYVPASTIWAGEAASLPDAGEALLTGLGRALRLFPDLSEALDGSAPTELRTNVTGAFRFLRQAAPLLAAAGFGVLLPQWAGRTKLGVKLTARTQPEPDAASSGSGLGSLVDFRWDLAVGDDPVSEEELAELARLKAPLVRLRGRWVELSEEQLEAALAFLRSPRTGTMTAAQAVQAALHGGEDALPLVGVD